MRLCPARAAVRRAPDAAALLGAVVLGDREHGGSVAEARQHEVRHREATLAVAERRPDAGVAEADDVGAAVAGDVERRSADAGRRASRRPRSRSSSMTEARRLERAVAVATRRPDAGVAEADDVGPAVAGDVGEERADASRRASRLRRSRSWRARIAPRRTCRRRCRAPSRRRRRRSRRCRPGRRPSGRRGSGGACRRASRLRRRRSRRGRTSRRWKRAVAVAERGPDAGVAEADDVGAAVAGEVGEERAGACSTRQPWSKPKFASTKRGSWNVPSPLPSATQTPAFAEADDVGVAVAREVGEEARMLVDAPAACSSPKFGKDELRAWNVPSPLPSATHTPASPKPTMSARPSPVRSARKRGCLSTRQPPAWIPKFASTTRVAKFRRRFASAVHTPLAEADDVGRARRRQSREHARVACRRASPSQRRCRRRTSHRSRPARRTGRREAAATRAGRTFGRHRPTATGSSTSRRTRTLHPVRRRSRACVLSRSARRPARPSSIGSG